ncbi:MAG: protein kinase, partial [Myxococcota bacterium]|nr:protein kinase [Myxococcota bacterium]
MCPGEETIAAYVARKLARDERDAFDSHLDTCSACQELVAAVARLAPSQSADPVTSIGAASTITQAAAEALRLPGAQLGRYSVLASLGAGGMGVVYAAYDPELDRKIAVKVLRHARAGDQLRDEARAIAKLAHPNVVAVHDVGRADGDVFIAMEHVDGVTVRDWLRTPHRVPEILHVFEQAGAGLAAAHRAGLVHRDVKPSNIMIGNDGRVRVLDFGLALADLEPGTIVGTPAYMAPEQQRGEAVDPRADQYAFCVALWEAVAGRRPEAGGRRPEPGGRRPDPGEPGTLEGVPDRVRRG